MPLHLRLADQARIERPGGAPQPLAAVDAALLAYLAVAGPTPRRSLGSLLWPHGSEAQAATALRQRLFRLRKLLGDEVALGAPVLQLAPGRDPRSGRRRRPARRADAWPRHPSSTPGCSAERDSRACAARCDCRRRAQALEEAGEVAAALPLAQALLGLDALSEAAHRRVMRLHYLRGDRAAALAAFERCEQLLKEELGARPSADHAGAARHAPAGRGRPRRAAPGAAGQRAAPAAPGGPRARAAAARQAWEGGWWPP